MMFPSLYDIQEAANRIADSAHKTPVLTCKAIDSIVGAEIHFKCENLQKVGAFKFRGACNTVMSLSENEATPGVATHSSGNHAQALALAAKMRGIPAYIVMPSNAPQVKKDAVAGYGAEITFCEPTLEARESTLDAVVARTGATFIHPYNDFRIISGAGTAAMELLEEVEKLDIVMVPVGGGGLLSGTALATHYLSPQTQVIAGEPAGADDAYRSLQVGAIQPSVNPSTIADGLLTSLGERTFAVISKHVNSIHTVSEESIIQAMRLVWERMKIIIEPSSAVPLAVLLEEKIAIQHQRIGIIISGGNVDLATLPWARTQSR